LIPLGLVATVHDEKGVYDGENPENERNAAAQPLCSDQDQKRQDKQDEVEDRLKRLSVQQNTQWRNDDGNKVKQTGLADCGMN